jgi:hypothetical protein
LREGPGKGWRMKRIVVLLAVVALMVVMMAMSVAPVSAGTKKTTLWPCLSPSGEHTVYAQNKDHAKELEASGYDCTKQKI